MHQSKRCSEFSIIDGAEWETCFLCGGKADHLHHIFEGTGCRKWSDKRKLLVRLCYKCHGKLHDTSCPDMQYLHELGQRTYEEKIGTREQFRQEFIRSYL